MGKGADPSPCGGLPEIVNGDSEIKWGLPTQAHYRAAFKATMPSVLMHQEVTYVATAETTKTGIVADEWERIFLLSPEDAEVFIRCSGE